MIDKSRQSLLAVRIVYLVTAIFLVALAFFVCFQITNMIDSTNRVNHSNQVIQSLNKIEKSVIETGSNQKSYLLTGDSAVLTKRNLGFTTISNELNLVDSLTTDNAEQNENVKTLRKLIQEKLWNLVMMSRTYQPKQISPAFKLNLTDGFRQMENLMKEINKMTALENKRVEQRIKQYTHLSRTTPILNMVLSIGAVLILLISYFRLAKTLELSQRLKMKVEKSNKELKAKTQELKEGTERFLKIFDNSPVAMTFSEIETNHVMYANNLFYTLFGYSKEEVIGRTTEELNLISEEENARLIPIILGYLDENRSIEELKALSAEERANLLLTLKEKMLKNGFEILYTRKNGETFFAIVFVEVINIGNKKYSITTYQDITERKEAQKQLAEEKAFAETVIENDPAMLAVYDTNLMVIVWNKKSEEFTGVKKEEILGKYLFSIFPEYNNEQWLTKYNSVLNDGKSVHCPRFEAKRKKGCMESWLIPLKNTEHQIIGVLGITRDITETVEMAAACELKNAELEKINNDLNRTTVTLQKSEERYQQMVAQIKDYAILFLKNDGSIENWNEGVERIKGYNADEVIGKNFSMFYTEEDKKNNLPEELLSRAAKEGDSIHEGWRVRKNGSKFWANTVITAVRDTKNNLTGFSKVTRDLTYKKIAEDKILVAYQLLERNNVKLQKINKELESVNYISSHDLQEPLRQIQVFASRISEIENKNLSSDGKLYFEKLNNAANRMQNLIADLLTYSRSKTEGSKFKTTKLNEIINQVTEEFAETIEEKHAIIETDELGEANVIPFQFRQMMYNLIGNSLKFCKPDIPPHIKIKNEKIKSSQVPGTDPKSEAEFHHISVTDNGIGFEPQYKNRIFEVFQRLHSKQKIAGTGIGLAIVKNIVDNHHGVIEATGKPNEGATFDIYIPISQTP